jgi:hypothetical protein
MRNPSSRRVAQKLRLAGTPVSHETINRWRRNGWRPLERQEHPLDAAREALDDAMPLLTGDPLDMAEALVEQSSDRDRLGQLPNDQLLHEANRAVAMATTLVAHTLLRHPWTVIERPGELALLIKALADCSQAVSAMAARSTER